MYIGFKRATLTGKPYTKQKPGIQDVRAK